MRKSLWLLPLLIFAMGSPVAATPLSVLLIGDSITYGTGFVSDGAGPPYAELLATSLGASHTVSNAGCGGASTLDWTLSLPGILCGGVGIVPEGLFVNRAQPHLPADIVSIMLGTNDAAGFFEPVPVSVSNYRLALDEIISNILDFGITNVILMTPPNSPQADSTIRGRLIGYREQVLQACALTSSVVCGPDVFNLLDLELHFEGDDVHPNALGHSVIAQSLSETIQTIPEPSTGPLVACALIGLAIGRKHRHQRT